MIKKFYIHILLITVLLLVFFLQIFKQKTESFVDEQCTIYRLPDPQKVDCGPLGTISAIYPSTVQDAEGKTQVIIDLKCCQPQKNRICLLGQCMQRQRFDELIDRNKLCVGNTCMSQNRFKDLTDDSKLCLGNKCMKKKRFEELADDSKLCIDNTCMKKDRFEYLASDDKFCVGKTCIDENKICVDGQCITASDIQNMKSQKK